MSGGRIRDKVNVERGKEDVEREEEVVFIPSVVALGLCLSRDGVHDGVLRIHTDGRVVLGVDDGGLTAGAFYFNGLAGGEGGVHQHAGIEAGTVGWGRGGEKVEIKEAMEGRR